MFAQRAPDAAQAFDVRTRRVELEQMTISGNTAGLGAGANLVAEENSSVVLRRSVVEDNKTMLYTEEVLWKNFGIESAKPKSEADIRRENDEAMKKEGYTHRVDAWIHPEAGGSDYPKQQYFKGEPSKKDIETLLAASCVKNDYKVTTL